MEPRRVLVREHLGIDHHIADPMTAKGIVD
jgi:hypothetical protein